MEIEPPEIIGLLYSAIMGPHDAEQLFRFEELVQFLLYQAIISLMPPHDVYMGF